MKESFHDQRTGEAFGWFTEFKAKDYKKFKAKYPPGSDGYRNVGRILGEFEMARVLVSHVLLNKDLYFDMSAIGFMWPRLEKIVPGMRKEMGHALCENAVCLAERQKQWAKEVWKPDLAWKPDRPGASHEKS